MVGKSLKQLFAQRLTEIREHRGLSKTKLGEIIGKTQQYISKLESSDEEAKPSLDTLHDLAKALNISPGYFLEDEGHAVPLEKLLERFDPEMRSYLINDAKESFLVLAKEAQLEQLDEHDIEAIRRLIKRHKN